MAMSTAVLRASSASSEASVASSILVGNMLIATRSFPVSDPAIYVIIVSITPRSARVRSRYDAVPKGLHRLIHRSAWKVTAPSKGWPHSETADDTSLKNRYRSVVLYAKK